MSRVGNTDLAKYDENEVNKKTTSNKGSSCKKRKKKKTPLFFKIFMAIYLAISVIFFVYVITLNMLPTMYLVIIGILDAIITGAIAFGIIKRNKKIVGNVICTILAIGIICIYGYIYNYLNATMSFINTMSEEVAEIEDYYIITLNNGKFNAIEDINEKNLHVFSKGTEYEDVKNEISSKVEVYFKEDESLQQLAEDILSFKSYVALVSASQYEIIKDEFTDFDTKTKIIYTATHTINNTAEKIKDENSQQSIENGIFNVYISGIDTSGRISNVSRSDANILATVNTNTHEVLLTSIPRDYYVTLHNAQAKDKLTHSGIYGINETVKTVEDLLDTDINYYVRVNFTTLIKLVDTLGGVDVVSDYSFSTVGYSFVKGTNHLSGEEALAFSRERYSFTDGDNQRVKNQQKVLEAIMKKCLNSTTILTKYTNILNSLSGSFQTNVEQDEISSIVRGQLDSMSGWNIEMNSLTGVSTSAATYSAGSQLLSVMIPNNASVEAAKTKINDVLGNK